MILRSDLTFQPGAYRSVIKLLCTLPEELRITHHSEEEHGKRRLIPDDVEEYLNAPYGGSDRGSFLRGGAGADRGRSDVTCDVDEPSPGVIRPVSCSILFKKITPALAEAFLLHMAKAEPIFGFVCSWDECHQRNNIKVEWEVTSTSGPSSVESGVGYDLQKYIPDFYWMTLLPDALAK